MRGGRSIIIHNEQPNTVTNQLLDAVEEGSNVDGVEVTDLENHSLSIGDEFNEIAMTTEP